MNDASVLMHLQAAANAKTDEEIQGQTWTTDQLREEFEVKGFAAPFCVVKRKSDGQVGTLMFRHLPRIYFDWQSD